MLPKFVKQKTTTIRVTESTHKKLTAITAKDETYDDILIRMIERELKHRK